MIACKRDGRVVAPKLVANTVEILERSDEKAALVVARLGPPSMDDPRGESGLFLHDALAGPS